MSAVEARSGWKRVWFNFPVRTGYNLLDYLLPGIPATFLLKYSIHAGSLTLFFAAAIAIIPLAAALGTATEELSIHAGPRIGGLLNATLGNATELILGFFMLKGNQVEVVKASLSGSVIGNILLVLGMSALVAGLQKDIQKFPRRTAQLNSGMLFVAMAALAMPVIFSLSQFGTFTIHAYEVIVLSRWTSGVLIVVYCLGLVRTLLATSPPARELDESRPRRSRWWALAALAVSTILLSILSEILVGGIETAKHALGISDLFMGVVVIAIIGNVAEHTSALMMARKNRMEVAYIITVGSSVQIALLVTPALVLLSWLVGHPMSLLFTPLELLGIGVAVVATSMLAGDGETTWFDGVQLLALYFIFAVAVYLMPAHSA
jgi:Ca2+:H+ antiporter